MIGDGTEAAQDPLSPACLIPKENTLRGDLPSCRTTAVFRFRVGVSIPNKYAVSILSSRCEIYVKEFVNKGKTSRQKTGGRAKNRYSRRRCDHTKNGNSLPRKKGRY